VKRGIRYSLVAVSAAVVAFVFWLGITAPLALQNQAETPEISLPVDKWLADQERIVSLKTPLIPGTEKHIHWYQNQTGSKTPVSLVYLHGFSATRKELSPVPERVADALGANLFETRLKGNGQSERQMEGIRAEDWLNDAAEALTIGAAIGERVILMGTSNGGALALSMVNHPSFKPVKALVLVSPNFGPKDPMAELMTWWGGPQLAHLVLGEKRSWQSLNEQQSKYWSTSYPTDTLIEMMRLVKFTRSLLPLQITQSLVVFYSPKDAVVDPNRIAAAYEQIDSPHREVILIANSNDPSNHVLAGDIMSPDNNDMMVEQILGFVNQRQ